MKKVLLVVPRLSVPGGVANYYKIVIPCLKRHEDIETDFLEVGNGKPGFGIVSFFKSLYDQYCFIIVLHKKKYDVVHVNPSLDLKSFIRDGLFIKIAKIKGIKVVVFFRGWVKSFEKIVDKYLVPVLNGMYAASDVFVVLSEAEKLRLRQWGIRKPINIETTVVADDLLYRFDISKKIVFFKNPGRYRILFMSRVEKTKGIYELLEAVKILAGKGRDFFLTISGDGSELANIKKIIRSNTDLSRRVTTTGFITGENKAKLLLENHIFCLPTHSEGLPNALLEAMAVGLIPAVSPAGGIKDLFSGKWMEFMISNISPEGVSNAIDRVINFSGEQKKEIIESNFNLIKERCSATVVTGRLLGIYRAL